MQPLSEIIKVGFHAYDLDTVLLALHLRALVSVYFDHYQFAIGDLKMLRRVSDELEDENMKMVAYDVMGQCFMKIREYTMSLKCHKK